MELTYLVHKHTLYILEFWPISYVGMDMHLGMSVILFTYNKEHMFYLAYVCLSVCLSVSRIIQKLSTNFDDIFGGGSVVWK